MCLDVILYRCLDVIEFIDEDTEGPAKSLDNLTQNDSLAKTLCSTKRNALLSQLIKPQSIELQSMIPNEIDMVDISSDIDNETLSKYKKNTQTIFIPKEHDNYASILLTPKNFSLPMLKTHNKIPKPATHAQLQKKPATRTRQKLKRKLDDDNAKLPESKKRKLISTDNNIKLIDNLIIPQKTKLVNNMDYIANVKAVDNVKLGDNIKLEVDVKKDIKNQKNKIKKIKSKKSKKSKKSTKSKSQTELWEEARLADFYSYTNPKHFKPFYRNKNKLKLKDTKYMLKQAIIHHSGGSRTSGHYTIDIKEGDKWYEHNDSNISETQETVLNNSGKKKQVYGLIYVHQNHFIGVRAVKSGFENLTFRVSLFHV